MPQRIQRRRTKDWKMPKNTIYVGRGSQWGNPFIVGINSTATECIEKYRHWLNTNKDSLNLEFIRGKNLSCWCSLDDECHADILLEESNKGRGS